MDKDEIKEIYRPNDEKLIYKPSELEDYIIDAEKIIEEKDKEIQKLNNIINELEKILYKRNLDDYDTYTANVVCDFQSDFNEILKRTERR